MPTLYDAFAAQLRLVPCSGDILQGTTREDAITSYMGRAKAINASYADAAAFIDARVADWKEHTGEHILFYLLQRTPESEPRYEIKKIWESDLPYSKLEWTGVMGAHGFPILQDSQQLTALNCKAAIVK